MTELERLNQDFANHEDLRNRMDAALKGIAERKEAHSDGEAMVKAAAELGYTISIADLERTMAARAQLDNDALEMVAGGEDKTEWCFADYYCYTTVHAGGRVPRCMSDYYCQGGIFLKKEPDACSIG